MPKVLPVNHKNYYVSKDIIHDHEFCWINVTALTAGGNNDTEIATPTNEPTLSPRIPIAAAAPVGKAVRTPINRE